MSWWTRVLNIVRAERVNSEIDEELRSHWEDAMASGREAAEARRALGSALRYREESRDLRVVTWLESLLEDGVFGWRQLCKRKALRRPPYYRWD